MAVKVIVQAGYWGPSKRRVLPTHCNAGLEVVLIKAGKLRWHVEGRMETVPPGSVFFTLPRQAHGGVTDLEPGCQLHFAVIRARQSGRGPEGRLVFPSHWPWSQRTRAEMDRVLRSAPRHCWPANERLAWLVPQLVAEYEHPDPAFAAATRLSSPQTDALAMLLLLELARCVAQERARPSLSPAHLRVEHFLQTLEARADEPWSLPRMAGACGLARSRFAAIVKHLTGDTPSLALNRARIGRAQHLLASTAHPITRIALDCGFSSSQYFAGVFRAYTGCSAGEYRHRLQHTQSPRSPEPRA
ncbi:MAG: AraC family transcriptional regulator [Phycisphaeraceae bacterium]